MKSKRAVLGSIRLPPSIRKCQKKSERLLTSPRPVAAQSSRDQCCGEGGESLVKHKLGPDSGQASQLCPPRKKNAFSLQCSLVSPGWCWECVWSGSVKEGAARMGGGSSSWLQAVCVKAMHGP